jgi:hypothetical protein
LLFQKCHLFEQDIDLLFWLQLGFVKAPVGLEVHKGKIMLPSRPHVRCSRLMTTIPHDNINVIGINQVWYRPAIKTVFSQAFLGEAFIFGGLSHQIGGHQNFEPNALVITKIVGLRVAAFCSAA